MKMMKVKELLKTKGQDVWSIEPTASVYDAVKLMADKDIGALLVMEGTKVVGVISERDYARKVILKARSSGNTRIDEIMTTKVLFARPEQDVDECMSMMTEMHVRHLPVMDGQRLIGVISIGDIVKSVIAEQQTYIEQLDDYIHGR